MNDNEFHTGSRRGEPAPDKHTPSPWQSSEYEDGHTFLFDANMEFIANVATGNGIGKANARLIAAAPNMLRALLVVEQHHAASPHIGLIRAAIAKALGDNNG